MNMDKLNQWLTLIANVGVVVGIVFLAFEIRHNSNELATQLAMNGHLIRTSDIGRSAMDENLAHALVKLRGDEQLTLTEKQRLWSYFSVRFVSWELNYSLGTLADQGPIASFRRSPQLIEYFDEYRPFLDEEFVRYMDESVFPQL